ncbi:MAG: hypothetical protein BWY37_01898 [Firmicutes bacterium ADurb.Bin262]|nr:MAG: hypothetical protein BWY37_01898 [Firmicutes bacterium ADurb.Bin262]
MRHIQHRQRHHADGIAGGVEQFRRFDFDKAAADFLFQHAVRGSRQFFERFELLDSRMRGRFCCGRLDKRRGKMPPDALPGFALVHLAARHADDGAEFFKHDAELRIHPVRPVGILDGVAPEAVTVTRVGVRFVVAVPGVILLLFDHLRRPAAGNDAAAAVLAALQAAKHDLGHFARGQINAPAAGFQAVGAFLPERAPSDAQRLEQPWHQVIRHRHPRHAEDDGRENILIFADVPPFLPRRGAPGRGEKLLEPADLRLVRRKGDVLARRHGQQVPHRHAFKAFVGLFRPVGGEKIDDLALEGQQALLDGKTDRDGGDAFAHRIHDMREVRPVGFAVAFESDFSVADDNDAVQFDGAVFDIPDKCRQFGGGDARLLRVFRFSGFGR